MNGELTKGVSSDVDLPNKERRERENQESQACTESDSYVTKYNAGVAPHSRRPGDVCDATPRTFTTTDERGC
jgi:hypothetical protein